MVKKKKTKTTKDYNDINLKEKDYNNDKTLAFFIEQKRKADEMLEEVSNFHKSFAATRFVDFNHILEILEHVKWIEIPIPKKDMYGWGLNPNVFIPKINEHAINPDLTVYSTLTASQKTKFKKEAKHSFGDKIFDLSLLRNSFKYEEYEEYNLIEQNAESKRWNVIEQGDNIIEAVGEKFEKFFAANGVEKTIENAIKAENELNEHFGPIILKYILKNEKFLKLQHENSKFLLTNKNVVIKVPSMEEDDIEIEISDDEKSVNITSDGDRVWRKQYNFPKYMYHEYTLCDRLSVDFDCSTNEYIKHEYLYSFSEKSRSDDR